MVYSNWKNHAKGSKSFIIIVSNFHSHETNQREPTVFFFFGFFFWFFFLFFFFVVVFFFFLSFFFLKAILLVYLKYSNLRMVHTVLTIMHWKIPKCA